MGSCTCAASKHKTVPRASDNLLVLTNYWDQTPGNKFITWSVSSTCSFSNVQWACCWCLIWKITLRWSSIQMMRFGTSFSDGGACPKLPKWSEITQYSWQPFLVDCCFTGLLMCIWMKSGCPFWRTELVENGEKLPIMRHLNMNRCVPAAVEIGCGTNILLNMQKSFSLK